MVVLLVSSKTMKQQDHIAPSKQPPKGFSLRRSCQRELTDEARNPPLWQIQADAAPMRQRVLQASALQNDYAEL